MVRINEKVISILNRLIEICTEGEKEYRLVAEKERNKDFKALFSRYSAERRVFASKLQQQVFRLGGKPDHSEPSSLGVAHQENAGARETVAGDSSEEIVAGCKKEEDAAIHIYEEALTKSELPLEVRGMVEQQYGQVKTAHDWLSVLKCRNGSIKSKPHIGEWV